MRNLTPPPHVLIRYYTTQEPGSSIGWNYLGLCYIQLGDVPEALAAYQNAVKLDPKFKEAYVNLAQLHREAGKGDEAIRVFKRAIKLDAKYMHAAHLYGLCLHGMGRTREALTQFHACLKLDPSHAACTQFAGLCCQSLGQFEPAVGLFERLLAADPSHVVWYSREVTHYYWSRLDDPLSSFNADDQLNPYLKEAQVLLIFFL